MTVTDIETQLEQAYQRLCDYDNWVGEFEGRGCDDPDETLMLWSLKGRLTVLSQIADGAPLDELIEGALEEAEEMTADPEDEEEDE